jgi:glyoxylase-like metal-dependent hydrolase (beta-lactamase superfamily II)
MDHSIPLSENDRADRETDENVLEVAPDVAYKRLLIVNVAFVGAPGAGDREWVLVDAGVYGTTAAILEAVERRFGEDSRPAAIVQTHGHFDHVGALEELAERWEVPVYAHALERPYLEGRAAYPPPDPTVGGGMMAAMSGLFPRDPVDVSARLVELPADGTVPPLPDWRWIHTPGHTPGHISLWRERDRLLIAGDAFVTTKQESVYAALTQRPELHGPPMYYTQDWDAARESVRRLAALDPEAVITGHGRAMGGDGLRVALLRLAAEFDRVAVPEEGEYVGNPARAEDGSAYTQP